MPTTTVAASMFRHSVEDESSYSQTWGISSNAEFQDVYWRSLAVSLATCRRLNPHVKPAVFTNAPGFPVVEGVARNVRKGPGSGPAVDGIRDRGGGD